MRAELGRQRRTGAWLAEQLGVSTAYVSRRLSGEFPMTIEDLHRIAAALGVAVADLMPASERVA